MGSPVPSALPNEPPDLLIEQILPAAAIPKIKKKLIRRLEQDRSQLYRRGFQLTFLTLNLWLGAKFYFWVRQFETGVMSEILRRPRYVLAAQGTSVSCNHDS